MKHKKLISAIAAILAISIVAFAGYDIHRAGSRVYVAALGDIYLEAVAGKTVALAAGTKRVSLDLTNISNSTTRTLNLPNANSTTVQANTGAANQFLTAISAQGVVSRAQPGFSDLSGIGAVAQVPITITFSGLDANSASGDAVFIAPRAYQVTIVRAVWRTAGGSAAAATLEKLTGTTAPGSGTAILTSAFDLTGTANTVGSGALSGTVGNLQLAAGDRLGVKLSGTLTALAGLNLTVQLDPI
jgi:hypothetical protein